MLLTIFTPSYNRAYCLGDVYHSLLRQTNHSFVWLIVDDGSTDDTQTLVSKWKEEGLISIEYHYQENAGKMAAHNKAAQLCKTELFVCLDSDDQLPFTAVGDIMSFWEEHRNDRDDLLGIIAPKTIVNKEGVIVRNPEIPNGIDYTTGRGLYLSGYRGETAMVFKADVLRKYPFPVQEGEKFISEIAAYDAMDEHYVLITYNHPLMICEYREDGVGSYFCNVKVVPPNADSFSVDKYQINFTQSLNFIKNGEMYGLGKSGRVASNKNSVEMKIVAYLKKYHRDHGRGDLEGY